MPVRAVGIELRLNHRSVATLYFTVARPGFG
jgi:hypothetical protein